MSADRTVRARLAYWVQRVNLENGVAIDRDVTTGKLYAKPTQDHDIDKKDDNVIQRLLTAFGEYPFGDGGPLFSWLVDCFSSLAFADDFCKCVKLS